MQLDFSYRNKVFILGAGASKDYGLPVWKELDSLIRGRLSGSAGIQYSRAGDILAWLDKVGEKSQYETIDRCITEESVSKNYYSDGDSVENELFLSIKDIFEEVYKENEQGWITRLNHKILHDTKKVEGQIAFVSYNYDNVLEKNLLQFSYLPGKHIRLNNKARLAQLAKASIPVLYAHGNLYSKAEIPVTSHTSRNYNTMKSGDATYIDVVSCYEGYNHTITHEHYSDQLQLYVLGLGGGLKYNLDKLNLEKPVSQISVTITDASSDKETTEFLSDKFGVPVEKIFVYRNCNELIEKSI